MSLRGGAGQGLCRNERIKSRKQVDMLYAEGRRIYVFPFALCWMECGVADAPCGARVMVSVSKRRFKHAVDRNRVKRLMRECYRLSKPKLYATLSAGGRRILVSISYSHNEVLDFHRMQDRYGKLMGRLEECLKGL